MDTIIIAIHRYILLVALVVFPFLISGCEPVGSSGTVLYEYTLTVVSGNNQTVTSGTESEPIVVRVDMNKSPVSGITVEWNITEGAGTLSSNSGVSGENGHVQTTYIPGDSAGDVRIRATVNFDSSGYENFAGREVTPVTFTLKVD